MTDKTTAPKHVVTLTAGEWQLVLAALGELPAKISRQTINAIEAQLAAEQPAASKSGRQPKAPKR